ncbi:MAG: S8 family serine peptidase, partial [Nitrososphaerota archaeon]|nr:S8 family serine peptidase [Nitrososphaerota archaeon]
MLAQKFGAYKKDVALGIFQNSIFKQRYGSKFFPADNKGRMFLCVTITSGIDAIADSIVSWGGTIHNKGKFRLFAWIPMDKLSDLSGMKGVMFVDSPGYAVAKKDDVISVGDSQLLADSARSVFYSNGSGVKVGVISDGAQYYTESQQSGDLPPTIGMINYNGENATSFTGDEGTAMMEIVHDLAPGAAIDFGGAGTYINSSGNAEYSTPLDMAGVINTMASDGCKVIVDDMGWVTNDPSFEDYEISQAIANFQANGGVYISAAGNDNGEMYTAQAVISQVGTKSWVAWDNVDTVITFTISNYNSFVVALQWDDEWTNPQVYFGLYLYDSNWNLISSWDTPGQGPPQRYLADSTTSGYFSDSTFHIMVDYDNYYSGAPSRYVRVLVHPEGAEPNTTPSFTMTHATPFYQVYGHAAAPNVISVAAYPSSNQNSIEPFSSLGPSPMFPEGNPAALQFRNTPVITATDEVPTYVGQYLQQFEDPFYGTSAAAPHVAAIAALYLSRYPSQPASQLISSITATAKSIYTGTGGSWNSTSGYGKIDAYDALVDGMTALSSPNVTSNTNWDLDRITGTATISGGVNVTIDANQTTVIDGTVNFGNAGSKILIYGTLVVDNSAVINLPSQLIVESGGRLIAPNLQTINVNQLDASNNSFGRVGHWIFGAFDTSNTVPFSFASMVGTPEHMRGQQYFKSGTTQKFQLWNQTNTKIINPDTFVTTSNGSHIIAAQFQTANDATIESQFLDGGSLGGTVDFLDPWFIDTTDAYGPRNQGMLDWARPAGDSTNDVGTGTVHHGVFLNQNLDPNDPNVPYYTVAFPSQSISIGGTDHALYFQNWTASNATVENPNSTSSPVVFTGSNATITANVKGNLLSSVSSATGYGNQC